MAHGHREQHPGREQEPQRDRRQARHEGQDRSSAGQTVHGEDPVAARHRLLVCGAPARPPLEHDEREDEHQQQGGQLGRRDPLAHPEPRAVDAGRERLHPEVVHGAEVAERLHERERDAGRDRRSRQRQRHGEEAPPRAPSEAPARLQDRRRLLEEGRARQQVDVRVEGQGQHGDRAAERADVREPVLARPPSGDRPQGALERTRELQEVGVGVRQDVRRHSHRQEQRPLEDALPGEAAHGHQPCEAHPDHQAPRSDAEQEPQRVPHVAGQHGRREVRPDVPGWGERAAQHHPHRCRHEQRQQRDDDAPPAPHGEGGRTPKAHAAPATCRGGVRPKAHAAPATGGRRRRRWRRGWDSNPRNGLTRLPAFQASSFNHSDTSPGDGPPWRAGGDEESSTRARRPDSGRPRHPAAPGYPYDGAQDSTRP